MKKTLLIFITALCFCAFVNKANAQLGNALKKAGDAVKKEAPTQTTQPSQSKTSDASTGSATAATVNTGATFYVCVTNGAGSRTADGSKEKPFKDLQAAIDAAPSGSTIRISEGNYLGKMDQGFIIIKDKYLTLEGGWNAGFTQRDHVKYRTMIQPGEAQIGTSGSHSMLNIDYKFNAPAVSLQGLMIIDGIFFDGGEITPYFRPIPEDPRTGTPPGVETGQTIEPGASMQGLELRPGSIADRRGIHGYFQGKLIIRNCVFANCYNYGVQLENHGGNWEIYNNIFVSNRMAGIEVRGHGSIPEDKTSLKFHNNTVLFTWTRTKLMEDMGYGFRYMTRMNYDVYDNIFGCNYYGALDRTRFDSDLKRDKIRETNAYNNLFFANTMGDICLPSGGGKWNFQFAKNFEEVEQLTKYEGNREVNTTEAKSLADAINTPYLQGFLTLTKTEKSQFDENSAMNTYRAAHGMNKQGTETVRVSMWGNRYPIADIDKLWGLIAGKGAQR
ncbi:MAG: DUF1565 domain-containing protein [Bacteroidales bacterium]|jgi:hypothetical protein|nr:DUF1565 domain-containing protein [Bacteroidales bacterium]